MNRKIKKAVEEYQCPGCVCGSDTECFEEGESLSCGKHVTGTTGIGIGKILLSMPKGFNRVGPYDKLNLLIFDKYGSCHWEYDRWNIPVWKYLDKNGNTIIRGISPRINCPFLHIFLEDCMAQFDCLEITQDDIKGMD